MVSAFDWFPLLDSGIISVIDLVRMPVYGIVRVAVSVGWNKMYVLILVCKHYIIICIFLLMLKTSYDVHAVLQL